MSGFDLSKEAIDLPPGAHARGWRWTLRHDGAPVAGFTQGAYRAFLHPLFSPAGVMVTAESPADHPHHNGIWVAADHVNLDLGVAGEHADHATYNFYVDETFQGRAPGRICETGIEHVDSAGQQVCVKQDLTWRGPAEWGSPDGRLVLRERRTTVLSLASNAVVADITTRLEALDRAVTVGPTRHALFGVRLSEALCFGGGGRLVASNGASGARGISGGQADWIDCSGPAGHRHRAGIAVFPAPAHAWSPWFATDWGAVAVNPVGTAGAPVEPGRPVEFAVRVLAHDGLDRSTLAAAWEAYRASCTEEKQT